MSGDDGDDCRPENGEAGRHLRDSVLDHVKRLASNREGRLSPGVEALAGIREEEPRAARLREFVAAMLPHDIDPSIWLSWLGGRTEPFDGRRLARPRLTSDANSGRTLKRTSERVKRTAATVAAAKRKLAKAQQQVDEAEAAHAEAQSMDAAIIEWAVSEHVAGLLAPIFAMGPAWTVMRAISAHMDPDALEIDLRLLTGPRRERAEARIRDERSKETQGMLDVLDRWSGDAEFELELREAIKTVTDDYKGRSREGLLRRSRADLRNSLPPGLARDADEILEGLKRS